MIRLGAVTILVSLVFLYLKWKVYNVERNGDIVAMNITKLPSECSFTKGNYFMVLVYEEETFNKKIPAGFCKKHRVGESIKMKLLKGDEFVLFPNESVMGEFIAIGIFMTVGFLSIGIGLYESNRN